MSQINIKYGHCIIFRGVTLFFFSVWSLYFDFFKCLLRHFFLIYLFYYTEITIS